MSDWTDASWWPSQVQIWIPADRISAGWESQIKNLVSSAAKSADTSAEMFPSHFHYLDSALCGCFPALSRKGSGSRGQVSIRPLLGGSKVLSEAIGPTGHAVRAHQSSRPLIRLQYFQHSLPGGGGKKKLCGEVTTARKQAHGHVTVMCHWDLICGLWLQWPLQMAPQAARVQLKHTCKRENSDRVLWVIWRGFTPINMWNIVIVTTVSNAEFIHLLIL